MAGTSTTRDCVWGSVIPHLALRAAKKLNPKAQCWRWNDGFINYNTYEPGMWVSVGTPQWLPHCIYAVTASKKEKPSWTPSPQQLKDASSLKKSIAAGKKPICPPEMPPPRTRWTNSSKRSVTSA